VETKLILKGLPLSFYRIQNLHINLNQISNPYEYSWCFGCMILTFEVNRIIVHFFRLIDIFIIFALT